MDNTIEQTLPMLPNPIQLSEFDNMDVSLSFFIIFCQFFPTLSFTTKNRHRI